MAVSDAMFIFEVVVESVKSLVESRALVIRSDFADVFSLELKDPKQMHIVIPDPPPLPPDPPGKKKKPPKPKKGKKGKVELPPPEPVIQSGQSVLFASNAEFLIQSMKKFPMEVSLWSKEDNLVFIGSSLIPWDPTFLRYLEKLCNCEEPPPVTVNDEYNVFEEETAKLMAKISIQVKLSYLGDKVTTAFRTLSEDPAIKKYLYTGFNSKTTSYICTMKTTDEDFEANCNKIENSFVKDKPKPKGQVFADYKNASGANLTFFSDGDYCCMNNADKPPDSIYRPPHTLPDIDFIADYIRKVVVSCNDNMRMLTPHPTIRPRVKATDIDRLCYCKETQWPSGKLAEKFKKEVQGSPCPLCINAGKRPEGSRAATFDIANIRGPCGKHDCKIARHIRAYIEELVEEDDKEIDINAIIGPCGSNICTLAEKIQEFLRHEGVFKEGKTLKGLSTQCACIERMRDALTKRASCTSVCSKDCDEAGSDASDDDVCGGKGCPFPGPSNNQVYNVYYFTVEHDNPNPQESTNSSKSKFQYCSTECPSVKASENTSCSKSACATVTSSKKGDGKCDDLVCPTGQQFPKSPADSDIVIAFDDIHNPCCVKTCNVTETVKDFIVDGVMSKKNKTTVENPCYCDCVCNFNFTKKTTYCGVCGGYECLGDDMKNEPEHVKPHPCPVFHKLYDKKYIKVNSPWPDEDKQGDNVSTKSSKAQGNKFTPSSTGRHLSITRSAKNLAEKQTKEGQKVKTKTTEKKKIGKFTANVEAAPQPGALVEKPPTPKYPYPPVPKNMGWNWTAEDIPGMKPRPKWKPGAANKILVRRYRAIREGIDTIAKKKRALLQRKKKIEFKPTLLVTKQDGEYTVQMEVFKKYSKERLVFQYPYEEKPPLVYTIGKTEEEKRKIRKQRERRERRETRRKSRLLQSTFRDKCQEICVKAYNQAIGLLPFPNPNDPNCPCHTEANPAISPPIDSCSCSEEGSISSSDTDGDDWVIEFTPPAARWDAKAKHPPVLVENESQYTYLDYKVKVLDKQGNQVARFFKGPDGKQVCSDLGGFWGPDHVWMEINKDGYIGPDNRWVPMNFIGPDGMFYSAEDGVFTDSSGRNLKIGIDGYVDKDGKWAFYSRSMKPRSGKSKSTMTGAAAKKTGYQKKSDPADDKKGKAVGSASPGKSGTTSPGKSAMASPKAPALSKAVGQDKASKVGKTVSYGSRAAKNPVVMSVSTHFDRTGFTRKPISYRPSNRYADSKKIARYREIINDLQQYDDMGEFRPLPKTNRASNTPRKKLSPFIIQEGVKYPPMSNIPIFENTTCCSSSQSRTVSGCAVIT